MELNGVRIPAGFNGVGCHDGPGCYTAAMSYEEARAHARDLKAHGVTCYKLFVSGGNKVERARGYTAEGILVIVRNWVETPWGRPPQQWVMPGDQIRLYTDVGVQLFEPGWNEFNIAAEWVDGHVPNATVIADTVVDAWQVGLARESEVPGAIMLFPSNTPGGNVDHRLCYQTIVAELQTRGLMNTVRHLAVHPRPHNNPPDTQWSATNTVTFDEWRWIRDQFPVGCYFWATEHGYSIGDDQNHSYPKIDLTLHTDYNWELDLRMNPAHSKAIEPQIAGFTHWFEAGWGAWGAWPKDSLRDSIVPEMPAPSPLWIRMGEQVAALQFERYGGSPPPPPPPPPVGDLIYLDANQQPMTKEAFDAIFGPNVTIETPDGATWYVYALQDSGDNAPAVIEVLAMDDPVGVNARLNWPDGSAISLEWKREPQFPYPFSPLVATAKYWPNEEPGPYWVDLAGTVSQVTHGLGLVNGTNHRHVRVWLKKGAPPDPPPPAADWRKPFDGNYPITCDFQCHKNRVPPSTAPGVDYACSMGTPLVAPITAGTALVYARGQNSTAGRWLELICSVNGQWVKVTLRHLNDYTVRPGDVVQAGQIIAHSGNTGNSTGPHLHVDTRLGRDWPWVDPEGLW